MKDIVKENHFVARNFQSNGTAEIGNGDLVVNYDLGVFVFYDEAEDVMWSQDIVETLKHLKPNQLDQSWPPKQRADSPT
jgi:hypothetical protein